VLDRLIAHCHTPSTLARNAAQQRSRMAVFVDAHPHPELSTLESLHVLHISAEQLHVLLGQAAQRMPQL